VSAQPFFRGARPTASALSFLDSTVLVESNDGATLRWLDELLGPWFRSTGTQHGPAVRVRHVVTPWRPSEGRSEPQETFPFVVLDSRVVCLPGRREGARVILEDPSLQCRHTFARPRGARDGDAPHVTVEARHRLWRLGLMRVVREIAVAHARHRRSALELHAAAFGTPDGAVVVAGRKGAGKTTLLLHALTRLSASFIANDRVLIRPGPGSPQAIGVPGVIRIRSDSAAAFPALHARTPHVERPALLTLSEADRAISTDGPAPPGSEIRITAAQLARALAVPLAVEAPVRAVVLLEAARSAGPPDLCPLSRDEAITGFLVHAYGGSGLEVPRTIVADLLDEGHDAPKGPGWPRGAATPLLEQLATQVPWLRLTPGNDAGAGAELLRRAVLT
jgi:hypothetical protein